eukprot:m.15813 g.15813  ORF g.15813 m.15813 type:complete len:324 (-) comp10755_c0_seq1:163-1134(-)
MSSGVCDNIPVLDLSKPNDELAADLCSACSSDGFFVVINHGIDAQLIKQTYAMADKFFALTEAQKRTALVNAASRGFTPGGEETLDPANQKKGDTKEGYYIGREIQPFEYTSHPHELQGANVWPDEDTLGLVGWKAAMLDYFNALHGLGMRMLHIVAESLKLPVDFFDSHFSRPMEMLRLLKYAAEVSNPDDGILGCGAHTDYGLLTFLSTDEVPGLEIFRVEQNKWVPVSPRPGDYIVNIGDMLERWTNKKYRSTLHRVVNRSGKTRFSIPFFFEPNFETVVECLLSVLEEGEKALFKPITSGQHLLSKYRETHEIFASKSQ